MKLLQSIANKIHQSIWLAFDNPSKCASREGTSIYLEVETEAGTGVIARKTARNREHLTPPNPFGSHATKFKVFFIPSIKPRVKISPKNIPLSHGRVHLDSRFEIFDNIAKVHPSTPWSSHIQHPRRIIAHPTTHKDTQTHRHRHTIVDIIRQRYRWSHTQTHTPERGERQP